MELYDKKYVYFDWDDKLEGKKGFFGDSINHLKLNVKDNRTMFYGEICHNVNTNTDYPFGFIDESGSSHCFRFCYCDPYYEFRKAYLEGKQLQFKTPEGWGDVVGEPCFTSDMYRIKPETIRWHVVLNDEGALGITESTDKHIYFTGNDEECKEWIDEHEKLIGTMRAWEEGKTIQYLDNRTGNWIDVANNIPLWGNANTYRVKPDECKGCMKYNYCCNSDGIRCRGYCVEVPEYVPFDTLEGLITKWEEMNPGCTNRPKCTMPMIWVKDKIGGCIYLIDAYEPGDNRPVMINGAWCSLEGLFRNYTFIDDSIIGKVKEE